MEKQYELADGRTLTITLTDEGIIADVHRDGGLVGTFANMADEFAQFVAGDIDTPNAGAVPSPVSE